MDEFKEVKKYIIFYVILIFGISCVTFFCNRTVQTIDNGIIHYEEFQEIYNTCQKINVDLGNMKELSENDVMFQQFSKAQRINTLKTQLNRWVEEYNAKSKIWNRSLWKSNSLPFQITVYQFNNY